AILLIRYLNNPRHLRSRRNLTLMQANMILPINRSRRQRISILHHFRYTWNSFIYMGLTILQTTGYLFKVLITRYLFILLVTYLDIIGIKLRSIWDNLKISNIDLTL